MTKIALIAVFALGIATFAALAARTAAQTIDGAVSARSAALDAAMGR